MDIKVSTVVGPVPVTVLEVNGSIDSATYEAFQSEAGKVIEGGARNIVVDLTHVPYVSSAGLRALQAIFNQLRALDSSLNDEDLHSEIRAGTYKSPHLKVLNLSKDARAAFEMAGFDMFIDTFTDFKKAIASF